jgi:predicted amidohydrolase
MPKHGPALAVAQTASTRGDIEGNVATHARLAKAAGNMGARMIVFPELSLTGYEPDIAATHALTPNDPHLQPLRIVSEKYSITIVAGAPYKSPVGLNIAAFVIQPEATIIYTKHHLHKGEETYFKPGMLNPQIELEGKRVSFAVCADTTHPEHVEAAAHAGAKIYAAGVFITPTGVNADSAQLRSYAEKYGMTVLMANYAASSGGFPTSGKSTIWDKNGNILAQAMDIGEALLITPH